MSAGELKTMTCIGCPLGCRLEVEHHGDHAWRVRGYGCKQGKAYGVQEASDPRRMVATTVAIRGARWQRLPVRTAAPIPKDAVVALCRALHGLEVAAPIAMGAVVLADALGTGVDVIASRSL
jgi:CxxC motif-containing protein